MATMDVDVDSDDGSDFSGFSAGDLAPDQGSIGPNVDVSDVSDISFSSDSDPESEDSDSSDSDLPDPATGITRWTVNDRTDRRRRPFSGPRPASTMNLHRDAREIDFFFLYFTVQMLQLVVEQTNLYACQKLLVKPDPRWYPLTMDELKAYLGLRVYMSIIVLPCFKDYWSRDWMFGNLFVSKIMKRDRFDKIMQYFHCADRSNWQPARDQPGHDKLFLIRDVLEGVCRACLDNYNPHQNCSVDEAMVAYRGRWGSRQYIPAKPTKYGIKVWMRADPTNGYCNDFQVYTGKAAGAQPEKGLGKRVVMDMVRPVLGRNHIVNCDNYFTSPELFDELLENDTYARGTVRQNRKTFPGYLFPKKDFRNRGDFKTASRGEMLACAWKDKRLTHFLTTAENPSEIETTVARRLRNGQVQDYPCPSVVPEYNSNMNGVDRADQMRTQYGTYRAAHKFWVYLFWFAFDVSIANAFIVMKESIWHQMQTKTGKKKERTMKSFRMNLAKQLIGTHRTKRRRVLTPVDPQNTRHFRRKCKKGRCRQCAKSRKRSEPTVKCASCNVNLCIDCFEPYHNAM